MNFFQLRLASVAALCVFSIGCAGSRSGTQPDTASQIEYQLPVTALQVKLDLVLQKCDPVQAKATLTAIPVVRPSPHPEHYLTISGAALASFRLKRDVKVELYPTGAIKSINGGVADRTGAIIGNILKIVTAGLAFDSERALPLTTSPCNPATQKAWAAHDRTKKVIQTLQQQLTDPPAPPPASQADPAAVRKQIDALAVELSRIEASSLTLSLTRVIDFWDVPAGEKVERPRQGGLIEWKQSELWKWFGMGDNPPGTGTPPVADQRVTNFALGYCIAKSVVNRSDELACSGDEINGLPKADHNATPARISCNVDSEGCPTTIVFREPVEAAISIIAIGGDLGGNPDRQLAQATFPMAQWGEMTYFPLTVGFGGTKTLSLGLDEFGRRTSFAWSSGARGEEITGGVQGIVEAAAAYETAQAGEDFKAMKAEADALELQQKLNKFRRCQAVLDAGGFVCPTE